MPPGKLQRRLRHATLNLTMQDYVHLDVKALDAGLNLKPGDEGGPDRLPSRQLTLVRRRAENAPESVSVPVGGRSANPCYPVQFAATRGWCVSASNAGVPCDANPIPSPDSALRRDFLRVAATECEEMVSQEVPSWNQVRESLSELERLRARLDAQVSARSKHRL